MAPEKRALDRVEGSREDVRSLADWFRNGALAKFRKFASYLAIGGTVAGGPVARRVEAADLWQQPSPARVLKIAKADNPDLVNTDLAFQVETDPAQDTERRPAQIFAHDWNLAIPNSDNMKNAGFRLDKGGNPVLIVCESDRLNPGAPFIDMAAGDGVGTLTVPNEGNPEPFPALRSYVQGALHPALDGLQPGDPGKRDIIPEGGVGAATKMGDFVQIPDTAWGCEAEIVNVTTLPSDGVPVGTTVTWTIDENGMTDLRPDGSGDTNVTTLKLDKAVQMGLQNAEIPSPNTSAGRITVDRTYNGPAGGSGVREQTGKKQGGTGPVTPIGPEIVNGITWY